MNIIASSIIILMICLYASPSLGHQEFKNIREECRSNLTGIFLNLYSEHDDKQSRFDSLTTEKEAMQKDLREEEGKFLKLRQEIDKKDYNPALQDERITYNSRIRNIKKLIAEYETRTATYKKDIAILKNRVHTLEAALRKVFNLTITMLDKSPKHGKYSIQMEYNHPCSKFYAICPLPKNEVEALRAIIKLLKDDYADQLLQPACERYADVIPPDSLPPDR